MRILNREQLVSHGNQEGRRKMIDILEAGLEAADPYYNTRKLFRLEGNLLYVGDLDFEADHDPQSGISCYDLNQIENIYVAGAGKGSQQVAKAIEEILGDRLTGGELICKYGDRPVLKKVHVTFASHPVPDENSVVGSKRILELSRRVTERDLVITIIANGGSALLTLPYDSIPLEDAMRIVQYMQIEKGAKTIDLNAIRNHIDQMKGGRISRAFSKAQMVHLIIADANHHQIEEPRQDYDYIMHHNNWLHNLPDGTTFADAVEALYKYDAWEGCPASIREFLLRADPVCETVKYEEFAQTRFRMFGVMPEKFHFLSAASKKAADMGFHAVILSEAVDVEAAQAGHMAGSIASSIEKNGEPVKTPAVLISTGEMTVTVDKYQGIGGRNQEYVLAAAEKIAGSRRIVIASVDTDGTDGPGGLKIPGAPACLGGGIVDGDTLNELQIRGVDVKDALKCHNTSEALWRTGCGCELEQNISMNDLTVLMILENENHCEEK